MTIGQTKTKAVSLEEQIKVVAKVRMKAQEAKDIVISSKKEWDSQNAFIIEQSFQSFTAMEEAENKLRELTLKAYAETGDKAPAEGVGIREVTKLAYDTAEAFSWATEHKMALKLDTPAFEKIVKATPLDFVIVTQEPQAIISQNLEID